MTLQLFFLPYTAIVVTDASIKNDITISISHVHICDHSLTKMVHHTAFITSTEVELFVIRCGINLFDSKSHLYQPYRTAILSKLQQFFVIN